MKKRINIITGFIVAFVCAFFLISCGSNNKDEYADYAKVIYHLEEGIYKGSTLDVTMYYPVEEGKTLPISKTIDQIETINPPGKNLSLAGWYKTKTENGYEDQIDSSYELQYKDTVELYARWKKAVNNKFVYKTKINDEDIVLATLENVDGGTKLEVSANTESKIKEALKERNLTYIKEFEVNSKIYSLSDLSEIVMEDADEDTEIDVYVKYIEGNYEVVSTEAELITAINNINAEKTSATTEIIDGIYLINDIEIATEFKLISSNQNYKTDLAAFTGYRDQRTNTIYEKEFNGNGHTITFKSKIDMTVDEGIEASIFHQTEYVNIHDVNFEVTSTSTKANVILAGLAYSAINSTIKNVNVKYYYSKSNFITGKNDNVYEADSTNIIENLNIEYILK